MKAVGIPIAIFALGGCNAIFGLSETHEQDAFVVPPTEVGIDGAVFNTGKVTVFIADFGANGAPLIDNTSRPSTDPVVKHGLMNDARELVTATYSNDEVLIPREYGGEDWRLVATFDTVDPKTGGIVAVPHEYQWRLQTFHITAPVHYGHPNPAQAPATAQYAITPGALGHNFGRTQFVTSGVWTETRRFGAATQTYNLFWPNVGMETEPFAGKFGAPTVAASDWQWLTELGFAASNQCLVTIGGAWQQVDLMAGVTASTPAWNTSMRQAPVLVLEGNAIGPSRFNNGIPNQPTSVETIRMAHGYVPKDNVPGFAHRRRAHEANTDPNPNVYDIPSDRPVMVSLAECKTEGAFTAGNMPMVHDEPMLASTMTLANYGERTVYRGSDVTFVSGIQAISLDNTVSLDAPLPMSFVFDGMNITSGVDDGRVIPIDTPRFVDLTWGAEGPGSLNGLVKEADTWEVSLYEVKMGIPNFVELVRVFHVGTQKVRVDSTILAKNKRYVFEVRSIVGMPMAAAGDFSKRTYPFSAGTTWSYIWKTAP